MLIVEGRVVAEDAASDPGTRNTDKVRIKYRSRPRFDRRRRCRDLPMPNGFVQVNVDDPVIPAHELTGWAIEHRVALEGLEVIRPLPRGRVPGTHAIGASCGSDPRHWGR